MGKHKGKTSRLALRESIEGYLFVTPLLVGLIFFTAGPVLASLVMPGDGDTCMYCVTDEQGHYRLVVPARVTAIDVFAGDFASKEVAVTVVPHSSITVNVELDPLEYEPPPLPPPTGL